MKRSATNNLELETAALNGNVERVRLLLKSVDTQTVFKVISRLEYIIWMGELTDEEGIEEKLLKCLELMIPKLDVNVTYNDKSLANAMLDLLNTYTQNEDYGLLEPIERIIKSIITDPKFVIADTVIVASRLYQKSVVSLFNKEQINQKFEGTTPLKEAIDFNFTNMVKLLIKKGADVNAKYDEGKTVLMNVVKRNNKEMVNILINNRADVNANDNEGMTPLMYACTYNNNVDLEIINLLIEKGANVNASTKKGKTPLSFAIRRIEILKLLIEKGADVNTKDIEGNTALMKACMLQNVLQNDLENIKLLIEKGADVNAKNNVGITVLDFAQSSTLLKLLIKNGATEASDKTRIKPIIDSFTPRFEQRVCAICLNDLNENTTRLPCGHGFHTECIEYWFQRSNECPQCREEIDVRWFDAFSAMTLVRDNTWKLRF